MTKDLADMATGYDEAVNSLTAQIAATKKQLRRQTSGEGAVMKGRIAALSTLRTEMQRTAEYLRTYYDRDG
jgi:hypothetical protein